MSPINVDPTILDPPPVALRDGDAAGGDLTGTYPDPTIAPGVLSGFAQQSDIDAESALRAQGDTDEATARADADALLVPIGSLFTNVVDHGLVGDNSTDNKDAWNDLIALINDGTYDAIYFPPGIYAFSAVPDRIVANDIWIFGAGPATRLKFTSGAAHGTLFTIGESGGTAASRVTISDLTVQNNATGNIPPATERVFHLINGGTVNIRNIGCLTIGGLCKIGSTVAGDRMQLYYFENIYGSWNAGCVAPSRVHIINGTDGHFKSVRLTASEINGGKIVHGEAQSDGLDQHDFDQCELWGEGAYSEVLGHGSTYDGPDYNVYLDFTGGPIQNWTFRNCVLDEGRLSGVEMVSGGGGTSLLREIHFVDCHIATNAGHGIIVLAAGSGEVKSIQVIGGRIRYKDAAAVQMSGSTINSFILSGVSMLHESVAYDSANTTRESIVHDMKHGRAVDDEVIFSGSPPAPLVAGTSYYVKNADANSDGKEFTLSATTPASGGATINVTTNVAGAYYVVVPSTVLVGDSIGWRVNACYMGPFTGAACKTTYAIKGTGSPDHYAVTGNVAVGMVTGFSTGLATSATQVVANNAT